MLTGLASLWLQGAAEAVGGDAGAGASEPSSSAIGARICMCGNCAICGGGRTAGVASRVAAQPMCRTGRIGMIAMEYAAARGDPGGG